MRTASFSVWLLAFGVRAFAQGALPSPAGGVDATESRPLPLAAADQDKADGQKDKPKKRLFTWEDHPSLRLGKGTHIDFRARVQDEISRSDASADTSDASTNDRV